MPITLQFLNQCVAESVQVSWVDYGGARVPRKILGPGEGYVEQSYATHPWVVTLLHAVAVSSDTVGPGPPPVEPAEAPALALRLGAAAVSELAGQSLMWQPRERAVSCAAAQARYDVGRVRDDLDPSLARTSAARVRHARAQLVQQLRDLRTGVGHLGADSAAAAAKGSRMASASPNLCLTILGGGHDVLPPGLRRRHEPGRAERADARARARAHARAAPRCATPDRALDGTVPRARRRGPRGGARALRELDDEGFAALDAEQDAVLALHNRAHGPAAAASEHLELDEAGGDGAGRGAAGHSARGSRAPEITATGGGVFFALNTRMPSGIVLKIRERPLGQLALSRDVFEFASTFKHGGGHPNRSTHRALA